MIIIIIIALNGTVQDFTSSSLRHELSPTHTLKWPGRFHVQITFNTSSAYHMQDAACHMVGRDSSAITFDRV